MAHAHERGCKISDAMDCRATSLYTTSFPGKAGFSRRHDGLHDRIYREAARAGLLAHREYAPAVMRGLMDEQRRRPSMPRPRPRSTAKQGGGG
jgi:hypothetical protein